VFRLCRYRAGGHFAPHFDGYFVENSRERSLQTFMLYLNGDFEGGSTNFVDENQTLHMVSQDRNNLLMDFFIYINWRLFNALLSLT
jgi:hypothetical protein